MNSQPCRKGRQPDPLNFADENPQRIGTEEVADADRRDGDRSKWEEIASRIKWREEGDTKPSVRQRVEDAM